MPVYDQEEWKPRKGTFAFSITSRHMVDIWVSCTKTVKVFGVQGTEATLLKAGEEFRFRSQLRGYDKVRLVGTGQTEFGVKIAESPIQDGEPNNGEKAPVLQLPEPSNMLLRMRQIQKEHAAFSRYPVLEPEEFPSFGRYEVDEDDEVLFEEEAIAAAQEKRKKAELERKEQKAKERASHEAGAAPPSTSAEKPQEPHKAPEASDPPPKLKAAE